MKLSHSLLLAALVMTAPIQCADKPEQAQPCQKKAIAAAALKFTAAAAEIVAAGVAIYFAYDLLKAMKKQGGFEANKRDICIGLPTAAILAPTALWAAWQLKKSAQESFKGSCAKPA